MRNVWFESVVLYSLPLGSPEYIDKLHTVCNNEQKSVPESAPAVQMSLCFICLPVCLSLSTYVFSSFFLLLSLQLYFILFIYVLILFLQKAVQRSTHNWHSASMCTKMLKDIASLPLVWTLHLEVFKCRLIVRESPLVPFLHSVLAFIEIWQFDLVLNVETPPAYINLPLLSVLTSASCESCLVHSNIASYLISLSTSLSDQSVYDLLP